MDQATTTCRTSCFLWKCCFPSSGLCGVLEKSAADLRLAVTIWEREGERFIRGSPLPPTQLSLRADTSFLPGATSKGSYFPSDSNRIKPSFLTTFVTSVDLAHCFLKLPWTVHTQMPISDPTWAVSTGPRWLSSCSIWWQLLAEVNPWLGLTLPPAQAWQVRRGLSRKPCLASAWGVILFQNKFLWNEGMQDNPFCNHRFWKAVEK